jgi:hypothetical protein
MTAARLIQDGLLHVKQACDGAPHVILESDIDLQAVRRAFKNGRAVSQDPRQGLPEFQ